MFNLDPDKNGRLWNDVPAIVVLQNSTVEKFYGPFPSMKAAEEWCDKQIISSFGIIPLHHPDRERTYDDFWLYKVWENPDDFFKTGETLNG